MRIIDAARVLGVSSSAVRNYCNQGRIVSTRNPGGQRIISQEALDAFMGKTSEPVTVFYIRSSSGDTTLMNTQVQELNAAFGEPMKVYKDRSSGLNDNRKGLWKMVKDAENSEFNTLCITHEDRLTRFNYKFLEHIFRSQGVELKVLYPEQKMSLEEELMSDFMSIISVFSGKFYRLRSNESKARLLDKAKGELDA